MVCTYYVAMRCVEIVVSVHTMSLPIGVYNNSSSYTQQIIGGVLLTINVLFMCVTTPLAG